MADLFEQAESDLVALEKLAASGNAAMQSYLSGLAKPLLGILAVAGTFGGIDYFFSKREKEKHQDDLFNSMRATAAKNKSFSKAPEKFVERFGELTVISPTIAKNPSLAGKILEKKINSGFSVDDIHKLTAIEHSVSNSRGLVSPGAAARAAATTGLRMGLQTFGPAIGAQLARSPQDVKMVQDKTKAQTKMLKDFGAAQARSDKAKARFARLEAEDDDEGGMNKNSSAQKVSDECLGQMLAERYVMFKTAGVLDTLKGGAKTLGTNLTWFAPALALGGGIELVRHALETRRTNQLEQKADLNFKEIMRTSDDAKRDPAVAREAFETLKAVAPTLAARPLVAKTFVDYTATQGRLAPETVQQLAEAENQIRGIGMPKGGRGDGFMDTMKNTMSIVTPKKEVYDQMRKTSR